MEFGEPPVLKNKNRFVCRLNYRIKICIWNHLWTNASTSSWTQKLLVFPFTYSLETNWKRAAVTHSILLVTRYSICWLCLQCPLQPQGPRILEKMNELTFFKRACQSLLIRHHYLAAASGHFQDFLNGCQKGRPWTCSCAALCVITDLLCEKFCCTRF